MRYNMRMCRSLLVLLFLAAPAHAGLYYSGEQQAELPSAWRGFLPDHRALRTIAVGGPNVVPTLLHEQYRQAAEKLQAAAGLRALSADEAADLGALYLRLGQPDKALGALVAAQRKHPDHFRLAANLGAAWQMNGDLDKAAETLRDALKFAPTAWKAAETYHLKLIESRRRDRKGVAELDDLFGVKYVGASGKPEPGTIDPAERKKLPGDAAALVQQLCLWFPADGRLLWQLGEIANAHGDVRTAAAILDGCVTEFAIPSASARQRRTMYRAAADEIAKLPDSEHEKHRGDLKFKSPRPLVKKLDGSVLPAIRPDGVNTLPWLVLGETSIARPFKPTFAKYLEDLDGKRIALTGFMQPVGAEAADLGSFLLVENPIGCWFCESPDPSGIVYVALARGQSVSLMKGLIKVTGTLQLNRDDPEQYVYAIKGAKIGEPD